jgi:TDG/mug DNA glycosylase family protein
VLDPSEKQQLIAAGCGITNLVARTTATADELSPDELRRGRRLLERKVARYQPLIVAIVGIGAYRVAFERPRATIGPQEETIAGARLWVLPNTSGLNANHQAADFAHAFGELRTAARRLRLAHDETRR